MKIIFLSTLLITFYIISPVQAWDNEDLEVFDVVDAVKNQNFYTLFGISQDAKLSDIKRAFRNLSVTMHPDKNSAEDANEVFRNIVSIYEILKDPVKREKYDNVLKNGMPNWRSAVYYYRKARKMGLAEGATLLFLIITVSQYIISWGVYLEKKYTMESLFESKSKKVRRANVDVNMLLNEIPRPSVKNTLPFQIPIGIYRMIVGAPSAIKGSVNVISEELKKELDKKKREKEEEELMKKLEAEKQREKIERKEGLRRRKEQEAKLIEKTDEELAAYSATIISRRPGMEEIRKIPISGGLWTDEDLTELVRLTKKYPGGTTDRWEIIAESMGRNVSEVTFMAYKLKDNAYHTPGETEKIVENINKELSKKVKSKSTAVSADAQSSEKSWTQEQQKALEAAIQKYPKRGNEDRWSKIANSVPGKTKEECQTRYKYLVELVKKQKEAKDKEVQELEEKEKENIVEEQQNIDDVEEEEPAQNAQTGGKKKNKRKEKKKNVDYYADDYTDEEDISD
ncbi:uncharacterized protein F54F2.9 [Chironomus tepperi]|uniref:uncharacterized protein F54F2.9 n=1 Tax=Chironomus tepperi TaxID=113505 RepID=UPI00391F7511